MANPLINAPPDGHRPRTHRLPAFILLGSALVLFLLLALGGYAQTKKRNPVWRLPNGDTVEILAYRPHRELTPQGHFGLSRIELVQFRSTLQDSLQDRRDIQSISALVCPYAFQRGYAQMKIEATPNVWLPILRLSRAEWFWVDPSARCYLENVH
jgi:hypothetical protein